MLGFNSLGSSPVGQAGAAPALSLDVVADLALQYVVFSSAVVQDVTASYVLAYAIAAPVAVPGEVTAFLPLSYVVVGPYITVVNSLTLSYQVVGIAPPAIGVPGTQSQARTYVVTEPQVRPDSGTAKGSFWNYANPAKPKGVKDPNGVIDIPFDWTAWFADSTDSYASHSFIVTGGLAAVATYQKDGVVVAFVSGGTVGATAAVTCRVKTNSNPPRCDDRTVYLKIKDL